MVATDIATRVWNHTFKLDPIVRSLLDTDFYKLLMLQMVWGLHPNTQVTFRLINRTKTVRIADEIDEAELRAQLDYARSVRFSKREMIWLAGNSFYGERQIFLPAFLEWLRDFQLPPYELAKRDGQYELMFHGPWTHTMMWEIPALAIINELRSRAAMKDYGRFELDVLYARAKAKMWEKVERLDKLPAIRMSDFGTRRRHSFLWQRWCVEALKEKLGDRFIGSSNVLLAMETDLEAIGTNAHELPMVYAAMARSDAELRDAPYEVLKAWQSWYGGNLWWCCPTRSARPRFWSARPAGSRTGRVPPRLGPADRRRRSDHGLVALQGRRSARQAARLFGRHGCRFHRGNLSSFRRAGAHELRLGHQSHQRLSRRRAGGHARPPSDLAGLQGHGRGRASGGEAFGQSGQGHGHARIHRALSPHLRHEGGNFARRAGLRINDLFFASRMGQEKGNFVCGAVSRRDAGLA